MKETPFAPGQVWEMSYDNDPEALVFYLLRLENVEKCWWTVFILESTSVFSIKVGALTTMSLRDVSFYHGVIGYDSYDNAYTRLA